MWQRNVISSTNKELSTGLRQFYTYVLKLENMGLKDILHNEPGFD